VQVRATATEPYIYRFGLRLAGMFTEKTKEMRPSFQGLTSPKAGIPVMAC
jgi:hypothetical protein